MILDARAASAGARVAGCVVALGYLLGLVRGPIVAAVGGLALITLGRALLLERQQALLGALSLAVIAGGLGISALRWATLDLGELRGAQGVLGPTVLVDPPAAAAAAWIALGASLLALSLWHLSSSAPLGGMTSWPGIVEASLVAFAIASAFWGPALVIGGDVGVNRVLLDALTWAGVLAITTTAPVVLARRLEPRGPIWWWVAAGIAIVAVLGAVGVIGGTFA